MSTTWDAAAVTLAGARAAVWAEADWEAGVSPCLGAIVPALEPRLFTGATVLELGCGVGRLLAPLARRFPDACFQGTDPSEVMVAWARAATVEAANAEVRHEEHWSGPDGGLDAAYSVVVLQHLPAHAQAGHVAHLARKLSPGGVLRLQFVARGDTGPLSHPVPGDVAAGWCRSAGLEVTSVDEGLVFDPWVWVTAVRA